MADPWSAGERQIEALISSRARANIEAEDTRSREQERRERIRRENQEAWSEHFDRLADTHAALEVENRKKARDLLAGGR